VGLITRRVYTRATIGGVEGGEGPAEPIKQVPDLSCSLLLLSLLLGTPLPRHSRGPKTRGQYQGSSPRGSILPPSFLPSRSPRSIFILPSFRRPVRQVCARPGLHVAVYHRPFVPSSVRRPLARCGAARRPVHCTTAARRGSVVGPPRKSFHGSFRYLSIDRINVRLWAVPELWHNVEMHRLMARLAPEARINKRDDDRIRNGAAT